MFRKRRGLAPYPSYVGARQDVSRQGGGRVQEFVYLGKARFGFSLAAFTLTGYFAENIYRFRACRHLRSLAPQAAMSGATISNEAHAQAPAECLGGLIRRLSGLGARRLHGGAGLSPSAGSRARGIQGAQRLETRGANRRSRSRPLVAGVRGSKVRFLRTASRDLQPDRRRRRSGL